jgi:Methyltransferase domain
MNTRPTLDEIAHREKNPELWTDKKSATPGFICHDYLRFYEREFSKWRDEPIHLLEIGVNKGASIKIWLEYFTKATIYGVDILPFKNEAGADLSSGRFKFFQGDQSDEQLWNRLSCEGHWTALDIVIDDGCHFSGPIVTAFEGLWPRVKRGGYYIVEDLGEALNPASHTPGFPSHMEFAKSLLASVILGQSEADEIMASKELFILRKK